MPGTKKLPVPMHRFSYSKLTEAQIGAKLAAVATTGPAHASPLSDALAGKTIRIVTDNGGPTLAYKFTGANKLSLAENGGATINAGYGAQAIEKKLVFAHLIPGTLRGYAVTLDLDSSIATVFELWFGGYEDKREVMREIYHGYIDMGGAAPKKRHVPTKRAEGKGFYWKQDTGFETLDFYPSTAYTHWVEISRGAEMGFSCPADYIQIDEDYYIYARTECEFSGTFTLYLVDLNRVEQVGLRLGFQDDDSLDYYVFKGTGEWLGQLAHFEKFDDVVGGSIKPNPNSTGQAGAMPANAKGARAVYRPLKTMAKMTPAEVDAAIKENTRVFTNRLGAGNGTGGMSLHALPSSDRLVGKSFTLRYDDGPVMDYKVESTDSLSWRKNGGAWVKAIYQAYEAAPGVILFGHLLEGEKNHDGHSIVVDFDAGLVTAFNGYLKGPYFANEAQARTLFGVVEIAGGVTPPLYDRHQRTDDMLGRAITWNYAPGLTSMHLYSTRHTVSWIIFTADQNGGLEWSGPGDFVKIRDGLVFAYWLEEACNGTLGTILINMKTMHDAGIGYHCGKEGLSMSPVGALGGHAGKFDIERFFPPRAPTA